MQFKSILAVATLATAVFAAPAPVMEAKRGDVVGTWTIEGLSRPCSDDGCTWSFAVERHDGSDPQTCTFSQADPYANVDEQACGGPYVVTLGWSDWFTLSLKDPQAGLISWPSYSDATLANGAPDTDFEVQTCNQC